MGAILQTILVLGLFSLALGQSRLEVNLTPTQNADCYSCDFGNFPTGNITSWSFLPEENGTPYALGSIYLDPSTNDSISYSEAICCKYFFSVDDLDLVQKGRLVSVILTFMRSAAYYDSKKPIGIIDYSYGFGIYTSANDELTRQLWTLNDTSIPFAPRVGTNSSDFYEGTFLANTNKVFTTAHNLVIGYQIINVAQDATIIYSNVTVQLILELDNGSVGYGVGFGLGIPIVFLAIFLPVYYLKIKPKKQLKKEGNAMEAGKNSQKTATETKYGAISGTSSTTSTGSGNILGGNYSPLGPTTPDAVPSGTKSSSNGDMKDRFNIPYREISFKREIGAGGFGKVFMGEWQSTEVAIKVSNNMTSYEEFRKEAELMINIRPHPNVLQVLGVSTDGISPAIIMEYCPGGSLDLLLFDKSKDVAADYQFRLILGIARGMLHLHKNNIVHRDLAARNILLSRDGEPKISDFGMSRMIESSIKEGTTRTNVGPIRWMAPESIKSKVYSTKSDVWSFGVVISEILNREEPHKEIEDVIEVAIAIRNELKTPKIEESAPELLKEIMRLCWAINPDERPEMDSLCEKLIKYKDQKHL
jgi:predicted Ser/Thr protein kinase